MIKTLILIRGTSGSGKSTLAKKIADNSKAKSVHFEADQFFVRNGEYKFNGKLLPIAHKRCFENTKKALDDDSTEFVIVSNTFVKKWEIQPYIDLANERENVKLIIFRLTSQFENQHSVPIEKIEKQRNSMEPVEGEVFLNEQLNIRV